MGFMKAVPALLTQNVQELKGDLDKLVPYFKSFHVDIADGEFVSGKTLSIEDATQVLMQYPTLTFDFHLMVLDYGKIVNYLRNLTSKIQIQHVFVHHKAAPPATLFTPKSAPFTIGLVINPDEQVKQLSSLYSFEKMEGIQIMSVNPGAQGRDFIKDSLSKIEQLRLLNYRSNVFLDGGINDETIPFILSQHFLPDVTAIGSFLTKSENLQKRVKYLEKILAVKP